MASLEGAQAAAEGGADRLELNRDLDRDGLTPSLGLFGAVSSAVPLPAIVMIRPHDEGYVYARREWHRCRDDVDRFLAAGARGIAIGALTSSSLVDVERIGAVVRQAEGREVVFHRAFDEIEDQADALERLIDGGVRRVLTSGGAPTAVEGIEAIRALVERAGHRIEVLPGAGLSPDNVADLVRRTGCGQVHGTFRGEGDETDADVVAAVKRALAAPEDDVSPS